MTALAPHHHLAGANQDVLTSGGMLETNPEQIPQFARGYDPNNVQTNSHRVAGFYTVERQVHVPALFP